MNKISKKIVALVTMAAFVLTLVPAAAFAAANEPVVSASTYEVASDAAGELQVKVNLNQAVDTPATSFTTDKVYVSIVDGQGQAPSAGTISVEGISDSASSYSDLSSTGVTPNSATVTVTASNVPAGEYTAVVYYGGVDSADKRLAPVDGQKVTVHDDTAYADNSTVAVDSITTSGFAVKVNLKDYFNNNADVSSNNNVKVEVAGINSDATVRPTNATVSNVNALATTGATVSNAASTYTFSNVKAGTYNVTVKVNDVQIGQAIAVTVPEAASETSSRLLIDGSYKDVTVDPETTKQVKFNVLENDGTPSDQSLQNVYIWAENEQGKLVDGVTFSQGTNDLAVAQSRNGYIWSVGTVENGDTVTANFDLPGTYYIYAGVSAAAPTAGTTDVDAAFTNVDLLKAIKVTVNAKDFETNSIALFSDENHANQIGTTITNDNNKVTWNINDEVTPNGVKVYTVYGVAYESEGVPAEFETLNISCAKTGIQLLDSEVGTDANGEFSFRFTMTKDGSYPIKIAEASGDLAATLTVVQDNVTPLDITTTEQGGTMLAGNDATYASQVYDNNPNDGNHVYFSDAVQFNITDINGKDASGAGIIANEAAADNTYNVNGVTHADYLSVKAPTGSDLEADDLELAWDGTHYTLEYVGNDYQHDLIPGEYTVKVSLNNSKNATATFKLAKFGTVQEITTELVAQDVNGLPNDNAITEIDDEVALGQLVTGTVFYVDENGIKVQADADELNIGINGSNSASVVAKNEQANPFTFTLANNTAANESLIGTTVTVKVFDETHQKYVEKTLTIVKGYLAETLSFDPTEGPINEDNTVAVSVVDENDKLSKVNGTLSAYIEKQSNADATVYLDVADNAVNDGKGELTLYSDQEGTVDVVVVVKAANGEMYGKTLTYTFGAVDPAAQNTVVMTIGSTDYVVNNDIISGDAAPYVDSNWRTMVPFRVLGETFGATVDWDQDNKTVTYTYGNTTLTMTIDSTTYTVNGEDKTMDTAPVLSGDRTYVPVRFVAEALGYEVTPLQDSTGLTASVVFQK